MTGMAHEAPRPARSSAKAAAWSVLVTMGGTSVTLNIWDATHSKHPLFWLIAGLRGFAPVFAAMGLSEAAARFDGGKTFRRVAFAIMTGAMLLSASAVANVLRPSYPAGWLGMTMSWLFGVVLDAAALTGLWIILTERKRKADALAAAESAEQALAEAERIKAEAARSVAGAQEEAARAEAELNARSAEIAAEAAESVATLEAELTAMRTELAAANATAEALRTRLVSPRKSGRGSGRKRTTASPLNGRPSSPPNTDGSSPPEPDSAADADTEAQALMILAAEPNISGSKLGLRLGKSERYGCILKNKLAPAGDQG